MLSYILLTLFSSKLETFVSDFIDIPFACNIKSNEILIEGLHIESPHDLEVARESDQVFEFMISVTKSKEDSRIKKVQDLLDRQVHYILNHKLTCRPQL